MLGPLGTQLNQLLAEVEKRTALPKGQLHHPWGLPSSIGFSHKTQLSALFRQQSLYELWQMAVQAPPKSWQDYCVCDISCVLDTSSNILVTHMSTPIWPFGVVRITTVMLSKPISSQLL